MAEKGKEIKLPYDVINENIDGIAKQNGLVRYSVKLSRVVTLSSVIYRVRVTGIKKNGNFSNLSLVCKLPPKNEDQRKILRIDELFTREVLLYNEIIPQFMKLQKEKNILRNGFQSVPKCWLADATPSQEYLLLEDMQENGFKASVRNINLNLDHVKLVMEELGKFHAVSFALRDQKPDLVHQLSSVGDAPFDDSLAERFEENNKLLVSKALDGLEEIDTESRDKLDKFMENFMEPTYDVVNGSSYEPFAVLCHGDCSTSNMLFKYEGSKPTGVCFVDFQHARYAWPVTDLLHFLFLCTDKSFRDQHYARCIKLYYDSFSRFLSRLGSDPDKLYPQTALENQMMMFEKYGLGMAIVTLQGMLESEDNNVQNNEAMDDRHRQGNSEEHSVVERRKLYRRKMQEIIVDMDRLGYL